MFFTLWIFLADPCAESLFALVNSMSSADRHCTTLTLEHYKDGAPQG